MKLLCILALGVSSLAFAGGNTGGTPTVPCWVDGNYQGNMLITKCTQLGGYPSLEKSQR
ncbi:hypothetical protein ACPV5O_10675 [Vibrio maritimus]|uniref:hypothetical protein n=1 Tax=Vibrio maritimus TaxID=990268 RepID=UPI0040687553